MMHAKGYEVDEKARLHERLPGLAEGIARRSGVGGEVSLDSYIVSATAYHDLKRATTEMGKWSREKFARRHILFPDRRGSTSGGCWRGVGDGVDGPDHAYQRTLAGLFRRNSVKSCSAIPRVLSSPRPLKVHEQERSGVAECRPGLRSRVEFSGRFGIRSRMFMVLYRCSGT